MENERMKMYVYMIIGAVGTVLIATGALRYQRMVDDFKGYSILSFGFILTISYINYLERKAEVSKKMIWTRIIGSITLCIIIFNVFLI